MAQRTHRLTATLQKLGLALGGEAGARQGHRQAMPVSADTLLRLTRRLALPHRATPCVLAVDDFAFRKGAPTARYWSMARTTTRLTSCLSVVRRPVQTGYASTLAWKSSRVTVQRNRDGAPQALQVLDRWHLIGNMHEAVVRVTDRLRSRLQSLLTTSTQAEMSACSSVVPSIHDRDVRRGTQDQTKRQQSRARRYELYAEVKTLHQQDLKILSIAKMMHISRQTVRRYIASEHYPEMSQKARQGSILDPYVTYLQERWESECRTNKQLYAEIPSRGYRGSLRPLVQWTRLRRDHEAGGRRQYGRKPVRQVEHFVAPGTAPEEPPRTVKLPGSQALAWLLLQDEAVVPQAKRLLLKRLKQDRELTTTSQLVQQFLTMVHQRQPETLSSWLAACLASGIPELATFAVGLQRELANVRAAVELPYSNGVAEGNVTRLKQIRRAMYGRGNFDLLRVRMLVAA